MNITYEERKELQAISKEVFGKTNWYNKHLVKKGVKKTASEIEANPTGSHYRYFYSANEVAAYMRLVESNAKALLEKMKAESVKNDISK